MAERPDDVNSIVAVNAIAELDRLADLWETGRNEAALGALTVFTVFLSED